MNNPYVVIDGVKIGLDYAPYIVAEISANHNGSIDKAKYLIDAAKNSGANAVKLQTYTADTITINCDKEDFIVKGGLWNGYKLFDLYKLAGTPFEWHKDLFDYARSKCITCFSTPFDKTAVDLLEDLNAPAYKVASFEVIDIPLIKYVASTKKPMIISTGMASLDEISEAVQAAKEAGCNDLILLHCISSYPAPTSQSNLRTIPDLAKRFGVVSGLSDHSLGTTVAVAAISLEASFIEKHFIISRDDKGPDSEFSIEPKELERLSVDTKIAWAALGEAGYERKPAEEASLVFRRSLYFVNDLKEGQIITEEDVKSIRPGFGIAPKYIDEVIGRSLKKSVSFGDSVSWNDLTNDQVNT